MNNVLIIEDDKEICVMIKDHLEKYNYQVFFTLTGANAIERIKELSPDLIILDLMLPFISGDELIRNIRKFSDVPVIVVSAKSLTFNKLANRYGILHEGKLLQEITATELDKRCKKHLLLQVNDVAAASVLLESKLNTSNFSVMPDKSIHLYDYVENAGKVSALLSANNITIYQLAQSGDSLETYYTNLIGGCQND